MSLGEDIGTYVEEEERNAGNSITIIDDTPMDLTFDLKTTLSSLIVVIIVLSQEVEEL